MRRVQRADPRARRRVIVLVTAATGVGLVALAALASREDGVRHWLEDNIDRLVENPLLVLAGALVLVAPLFAAGAYFLVLGRRVARARRFPPPGVAVARDTPVVEGLSAVWRGRFIGFLALFLIGSAAALAAVLWYLFRSLGAAG